MAKCIISREAEEDIDDILEYIALDNFEASIAFYGRLTALFDMLADNPEAGRGRPEIKEDIRSFPDGNYLILYRSWAGQIAIVRVLHAGRDIYNLPID